jgi:hypothetical protein
VSQELRVKDELVSSAKRDLADALSELEQTQVKVVLFIGA